MLSTDQVDMENGYFTIFQISEDSILIYDIESKTIVDMNPKACVSYGFSRAEMIQANFDPVRCGLPTYNFGICRQHFADAVAGQTVRFDWYRQSKTGSCWDEVVLKKAEIDGHDRIVALIRDITERKNTEQALKDREEQYRAIFNSSIDGLSLWNQDADVVAANTAMSTMFGYDMDQFSHISPWQIIHPDYYYSFEDMLETIREGIGFFNEIKCIRKDGSIIDLEIHGVPMQYRSQPHILIIAHDVTARKLAEKENNQLQIQLRQSQKMEAIGQLTGGIAHDFNNILTGIMGYIVLAIEQQQAYQDKELTEYLDCAYQSGKEAKELIQQMLTFSRGKHGRPLTVIINDLVGEAIRLLRPSMTSSIEIITRLGDQPLSVDIDPVQFGQVLMNLFINARDAMVGSGTIVVSLAKKKLADEVCTSCQKPFCGEFIEISVGDTGTGIHADKLNRIFEPFFSTKGPGKGSGMGLSTVHGIVHDCGGHILVESSPHVGSSFHLYLAPSTKKGIAYREMRPSEQVPAINKNLIGRVLIVDDKIPVASYLQKLIQGWGASVTVHHSGFDAYNQLRDDPLAFDIVITDQAMPKMTGLELAKKINKINKNIPIVLYTGFDEDLSEQSLTECGIRTLLKKPAEPAEIFHIINTFINESDHAKP